MPMSPEAKKVHRHTSKHRAEVLASGVCACGYCRETFVPAAIAEWTDKVEGVGQTALCPKCGVDAVLGNAAGYDLTPEFLMRMHEEWF